MFWNPQEILLKMVTEIFEIDASWAEKLTKRRVPFLSAPTVCAQSFYQTTTLFPPSWSIFTHEHTTHPPSGKIHDKCFRYFGWIQNESDGDFIEILRLIFPGSDCQTLHLSIFNMKISDTCSFYKLYKYFTMKFIKKVQASGFQQFGLKTPMSLENVTKNVTYN